MEEQLKCVLLLSLKEMALRRVAITVWSGSDILASASKFNSSHVSNRVWREAIKKIKGKMLKLELPTSLIEQMNAIVRPITLEARQWNRMQIFWDLYHRIALPDSVKLCWTTSGTVNLRQIAEQLLRFDGLDAKQRFEIACYYCLEDSISLYWEELSEEEKGNYGKNKGLLRVIRDAPHLFSIILKGKHSELDELARKTGRNLTSFHQFAFECSAEEGDKTAAEYFFKKLTPEEREASLMRTAHAVIARRNSGLLTREKRSDLLYYLLSVMTPEQQMEMMKSYPIQVFSCFLHWPLQDLFSDNAGLLWTFLPPSSYVDLVDELVSRCVCSDIYFAKIFEEFFMSSPPDFKKGFVDEELYYGSSPRFGFLDVFFNDEDSESIQVMFRSLDAADRVKLVFKRHVLELFCDYMMKNRWRLVEVCLREATLSKEEKRRLKRVFTRFLDEKGGNKKVVYKKSQRLFEFLDVTDASSNKRGKGQKSKQENGSPEH